MPSIPLYNAQAIPGAWHQVRAPGGYECWRCEADDTRNDRQIIAELWHGDAFDATYIRNFSRYARLPTRTNPPLPQQFICVKVMVVQGGRIEARSEQSYPFDQFAGQSDRADVRIGPNQLCVIDGVLTLSIATEFGLTLTMRARIQSPTQIPGGRHKWMLNAPLCDATGELRLDRTIAFSGRACHDQLFGDRPLVSPNSRTLRGRIMTDDRCAAFCISENPREAVLVEATADGSKRHGPTDFEIDWSRLTVNIPPVLKLHPPVKLESTPTVARQMHEAELHGKPAHVISELF